MCIIGAIQIYQKVPQYNIIVGGQLTKKRLSNYAQMPLLRAASLYKGHAYSSWLSGRHTPLLQVKSSHLLKN